MNPLRLLLAEIRYRKLNFALGLLAVAIAVTLFVAGPMLVEGYRAETESQSAQWKARVMALERLVSTMRAGMARIETETTGELARLEKETRRLMRDLGFNLMIVHRDAKMSDFWDADFAAADMPQQYVDRLAADRRLTLVTHLVATLQAKITWGDRKVLLAGYLPETPQPHLLEKSSMGYNVPRGKVLLGHELGRGKKRGEPIEVLGRRFLIADVWPERGSKDDITVAMHLEDTQELLKKPKRINQIMALECRCPGTDLATIRQQLREVLPDTQITEFQSIAVARAEQRALVEARQKAILAEMEKNLELREQLLVEWRETAAQMEASRAKIERLIQTLAERVTPLVVAVSAIWLGLLSLSNVRQRRTEIGLLRALGKGPALIAWLFLGKAVVLGFLGGVFGLSAGIWLARWLGISALDVPVDLFALRYETFFGAVLGAPLISAVAGYLPMLVALRQDPASVLREA